MAKCNGKNSRGDPCKVAALKGDRFCFNHSPSTRAQQAAARKLGGIGRHSQHAGETESVNKKPRTISDVMTILDYALEETLELDNGVLRGRLLVAIVSEYTNALKVGALEVQLAELLRVLQSREEVR
jgi:hypothetical protein